VVLTASCSAFGTADTTSGASFFARSNNSESAAAPGARWRDPGELSATELQGYGPAIRRSAAPARTLRVSSESGCNKPLPSGVTAGKTALRSIVSGDLKRTYRLHIPSRATTTARIPIVLNFHGRTSTGIDQEIMSGLIPVSDRETFILVSPDGTGTPLGWTAGATSSGAVDDVRFVNDLLDTLARELCVDTGRVFATGFSNGAFLSSRLACVDASRITAIAAVGGVHYPQEGCSSRVPVLAIHGTRDTVVPMNGGIVRAWKYPGAEAAMVEWATSNGCAESPSVEEARPGVKVVLYTGCNVPTELVTVEGAGHAWPGAPGTSPSEPIGSFSAAEMIWSFFKAAPLQ
jgi:polyhydroxybutyrate depolymerase